RLSATDGAVVSVARRVLRFLELPSRNRLALDALDLLVQRRFHVLDLASRPHRRRDAPRARADAFVHEPTDACDELQLLVELLIEWRAIAPEAHRAEHLERILIGRVARHRLVDDERVRQPRE